MAPGLWSLEASGSAASLRGATAPTRGHLPASHCTRKNASRLSRRGVSDTHRLVSRGCKSLRLHPRKERLFPQSGRLRLRASIHEAGCQCLRQKWSFTAVCCVPGAFPLRISSYKTYSRSLYYKLALEQLQNHPEAQEALGPPVNIHHLKLTGKDNFVDIADAKLKIPVSGSKSEGHLHVHSTRSGPFQRWHLDEVFLELKNGQQIPVFNLSGENGDEVKKE
nr:uncharacterized protein LOC105731528 [Aotus nancymaae]